MKTNKSMTIIATLSATLWITACKSGAPVRKTPAGNQPAATSAANAPQPETGKESNKTAVEIAQPETDKSLNVGSLATPTDAYKTAFAARQKKDVNGLKQVLSKKMLDFFTEMGADEKKTLDDELKELAEQPQAASAEARNEKIEGDRATLEYLDERGKWKPMAFVKETGEWKLTMPAAQPPVVENTVKK